mmetsp:Transcript_23981/g.80569  ORF Transcript_23981/g.80569 Transcript_23981/m.80569 type:complete len:452 (+) Transcript_23981:67-1422(+)
MKLTNRNPPAGIIPDHLCRRRKARHARSAHGAPTRAGVRPRRTRHAVMDAASRPLEPRAPSIRAGLDQFSPRGAVPVVPFPLVRAVAVPAAARTHGLGVRPAAVAHPAREGVGPRGVLLRGEGGLHEREHEHAEHEGQDGEDRRAPEEVLVGVLAKAHVALRVEVHEGEVVGGDQDGRGQVVDDEGEEGGDQLEDAVAEGALGRPGEDRAVHEGHEPQEGAEERVLEERAVRKVRVVEVKDDHREARQHARGDDGAPGDEQGLNAGRRVLRVARPHADEPVVLVKVEPEGVEHQREKEREVRVGKEERHEVAEARVAEEVLGPGLGRGACGCEHDGAHQLPGGHDRGQGHGGREAAPAGGHHAHRVDGDPGHVLEEHREGGERQRKAAVEEHGGELRVEAAHREAHRDEARALAEGRLQAQGRPGAEAHGHEDRAEEHGDGEGPEGHLGEG